MDVTAFRYPNNRHDDAHEETGAQQADLRLRFAEEAEFGHPVLKVFGISFDGSVFVFWELLEADLGLGAFGPRRHVIRLLVVHPARCKPEALKLIGDFLEEGHPSHDREGGQNGAYQY